jgi:hypothetical protein
MTSPARKRVIEAESALPLVTIRSVSILEVATMQASLPQREPSSANEN